MNLENIELQKGQEEIYKQIIKEINKEEINRTIEQMIKTTKENSPENETKIREMFNYYLINKEYVCTKQYLDNDIPQYANKKRDYYDDNAGISQVAKIIQANKLSEHMREYYDGNITIIGNTKIKPYDNLDIQDRYTNMMGKIEVQQVITKYDNEDGFITTVVPNMITDTSIPHNIGRAWNVMMNVNTMIVYIAGQVIGQTAFSGLPIGIIAQQEWAAQTGLFIGDEFVSKQQGEYILNYSDEQQHSINSIYNSPMIRPIKLNNRLLVPHFDHFVYNSLGQLDIVLGNTKKFDYLFGKK